MDDFHVNRERLFLVAQAQKNAVWGDSPLPLARALSEGFSQVEATCRIIDGDIAFLKDADLLDNSAYFADAEFFEMFTFPLKWGSAKRFGEIPGVVLSEAIAKKYFGEANPVGNLLNSPQESDNLQLEVLGVFESFPESASFTPEVVIPIGVLFNQEYYDEQDWTETAVTFVQLYDGKMSDVVQSSMPAILKIQNEADPQWKATGFPLVPLTELAIRAEDLNGTMVQSGTRLERNSLFGLTSFLIVLACLNYINIALASGGARLKEIGIRKMLGSARRTLISQFVFENIIYATIALGLGWVLAGSVFIGSFNELLNTNLRLSPSFATGAFALAIILFLAIVSSIYPSIYISSFHPATVLKGKLKNQRHSVTRLFMTMQLVLTTICVLASVGFLANVDYLKARDWGYNQEQVIALSWVYGQQLDALLTKAESHPDVIAVSRSVNHVGVAMGWTSMVVNDDEESVYNLGIGDDYLEVMGMHIKDGRKLNTQSANDKENMVVVNEAFVEEYQLHDGYEEFTFRMNDTIVYRIAGVIKDFHFYPFYHRITPMFLFVGEENEFNHALVRTTPGNGSKVNEFLRQAWKEVVPNQVYRGVFQDDVFDDYLNKVSNHGKIISIVALLAIVLSCMGLVGMQSLRNIQRYKEYSIRKVIGATSTDLLRIMNKDLGFMLAIAFTIALPLGYVLVSYALDSLYTYYLKFSISTAVTGTMILLLIVFLTISTLMRQVLFTNPMEHLREE